MTQQVEVTERMRSVWASADFSPVASHTGPASELLVLAADVHPNERVLDVAAGTGNTALAASRRWATVTASDFVPELLEVARRRAASEGLEVETEVADVQALPWPAASFDVVLSSFGAMFAPDRTAAAGEMCRVCRPGGRVAMANWTPDGLVGASLDATRAVLGLPPEPLEQSALLWGTEEGVRSLLPTTARTTVVRRTVDMCAGSPRALVDLHRRHLAPTRAAFDALDTAGQWELANSLEDVFARFNRATDGTLVAPAAYLEVVATLASSRAQ